MKEKTVKTLYIVVGLKYHRGTFAWSVTQTWHKSKSSVLWCEFLDIFISRVMLRQTGTLTRDSMIEELVEKIPFYPLTNKIKTYIPVWTETGILGLLLSIPPNWQWKPIISNSEHSYGKRMPCTKYEHVTITLVLRAVRQLLLHFLRISINTFTNPTVLAEKTT